MNSALITILLVCLMVLDSATAQWEVSGGISTTNSGAVKAEVKVTFKWGKRKSRSTREEVFDVMLYMVNTQTGSSVRLNPCDFALYDQDGDMEVTMKDFDLMFAQMEKDQHRLIEQLFSELDRDHDGKISLMEFEEMKRHVISKKSCS